MTLNTDSSPFQSSPLDGKASPRLFWQSRNNENSTYGSGSPSPTRRSSIERLQKASRVKNSNILALEQKQEYDPTRIPQVERPLSKVQGNAFGGTGISGYRDNTAFAHTRSESQTRIPQYSPTKSPPPLAMSPSLTRNSPPNGPRPASRDQASPTKSSLAISRFKSSFDVDNELNSSGSSYEDRELPSGMVLHRHAKSVTFDAAPPQVNEYEMATPDISSIASSSREGSIDSEDDEDDDEEEHYFMGADDHDDSFDATLEDTVKTPVVLPDDWRQDMANPMDEVFEGSPKLEGFHNFPAGEIPQQDRTDSRNSNRPLPPLPPPPGIFSERRNSNSSLNATAERMIGSSRTLPSPPPASSFSKADIQNIGNGKMTLEERLKLMMLSDDGKSAAEQQRERRMRRAGTRDRADSQTPEAELHDPMATAEEDDTLAELSGLGDYELPAKISRESIMRRVDGNQASERESDYNFSSPPPSSPERPLHLDPDVPIPSTEDSAADEIDHSTYLRPKDEQDDDDMSITDYYQHSESGVEDIDEDGNDDDDKTYDSASNYSGPDLPPTPQEERSEEEQLTTPRAASPTQQESSIDTITEKDLPDLPDLPANQKHNPFTDDLQSFMLPKPDEAEAPKETQTQTLQRPFTPKLTLSKPEYDGSGWGEPDEDDEEPKTPDSVIHRPLPSFDEEEEEPEEERHSPAIPETVATIKSAAGSRLKTRASATPSDMAAMREQRRQVSCEVPQIPDRHRNRMSRDFDSEQNLAPSVTGDEYMQRHPSFKSRSLTLDLDLGLSLDDDFERVIEAQKVAFQDFPPHQLSTTSSRKVSRQASSVRLTKQDSTNANIISRKQRGYLMRQNTKVVAASDKDNEDLRPSTRSAGNSPVKQTRPQSWTVEPWNGQVRKKSLRKRHTSTGPVPPLPGQESNAAPMSTLVEEDASTDISAEETGERGRVFVKVMGVKDLDLPMPKSKRAIISRQSDTAILTVPDERTWFSLTLDNGVHCVTTAWLELARNAPIGQEFELVVPNDLEFQLTLNVKLERPPPQRMAQSPASPRKTKTSTFSRVFASPKKRKEMELRQKEEDERLARQQREAHARKTAANPTAWDLLSPLAAEDGSFARAYVCLKEHETRCFGRPYIVDVACFNEWATEEAGFASSVKSKRGSTSIVRKAPYKIGKLELQLLFVPRPKGSTDEDMPKSMNSCIREMKVAEERRSRNWEGPLSQQGGDCPVSSPSTISM